MMCPLTCLSVRVHVREVLHVIIDGLQDETNATVPNGHVWTEGADVLAISGHGVLRLHAVEHVHVLLMLGRALHDEVLHGDRARIVKIVNRVLALMLSVRVLVMLADRVNQRSATMRSVGLYKNVKNRFRDI